MKKNKRAAGKDREGNGTRGRRCDPDRAPVNGEAAGATVYRPGFGPSAARFGDGAAAALGSMPRFGQGRAFVGGRTAVDIASRTAAAADRSSFMGTTASTLGNHGCASSASTTGGFLIDFFGCWDAGAGAGASMIPPPFVPPQAWDTDPRPPGGFMNFFHNQPQQSQSPNFHHVNAPSHWNPFKAPRQVDVVDETPPVTPTPNSSMEYQADHETVNVDSGDEVVRTEKRLLWTPEEDDRLMSAWLNNSMDPISGNDKRNEQYWDEVIQKYNLTTPKHRKRNMKQAKDRLHKINKWVDLFHSAYIKAQLVYSSGHSEQDWIDKAHKFYLADNKHLKLGSFVLMDVWNSVRNEAKWITYNKGLKQARQKKESDEEDAGEKIDDDERPLPRPMGQKRAKKLLYEGRSAKFAVDVDELSKFEKIQTEAHTNRLKVLEIQQKLSTERMESLTMQKEARKFELDAKMMETYTTLVKQDQGLMTDEEKADHVHTLKVFEEKVVS